MTFVVDEAYLPATLTASPMTDEEFAEFCAQYPDYLIEMTAEGQLLIMPPNYSLTSLQNSEINSQLVVWNMVDRGGLVTDSSGRYVLANGARRSPDVAWVRRSRLTALPEAQRQGYWHLCPDFVIELKSKTDRLPVLRRKMQEWISNGAELGWLIDPERRAVEIYRQGCEAEVRAEVDAITATCPVEGFTLNLDRVWNPLE